MRWSTGIILFVNVDDEVHKLVCKALAASDYIILHTATAQEALSVLSRLNSIVDLVVIDLELPDAAGLGIFGLLTTPEHRNASKIIAKMCRQDKSSLEKIFCLGVDAIRPKSTSAEQLVGTVQAALSGS